MKKLTKSLFLGIPVCLLASGTAFAQPQVAPPANGGNPRVEITVGFDGPVHRAAEFPGLSLSGAALIPRGDRFGFGIVAEADAAYLRPSKAAGIRVYARKGSLAAGKHATFFAQVLAGVTKADDQGLFHSKSSTLVQPGVGINYGNRRVALHVQADYHHLSDGVITKTGKIGEPVTTETLPNFRFLMGFTWRLWMH
jgi:hypothetical protein